MDFKEIQHIWKNSFKEKTLSEDQIHKRLQIKDKSNTALGKLKRNYRFEIIVGGLEYLFIIAALFYFLDLLTALGFTLIVSALMGFSLFSAWNAFSRIRTTIYTTGNLKESLIKTTDNLQRFMKKAENNTLRYIQIPIALITGVCMGLFVVSAITPDKEFLDIVLSLEKQSIVKIISLIIIGSAVMIPFSIRYFKKRFKKHYDELKMSREELEKQDSNTETTNTQ